jgi:hypothetical protein
MRRSLSVSIVVLAVVVFASSAAFAHVSVSPTSLTIQARGLPVEEGDTLTITGRLVGPPRCRPGQDIDLVLVGAGVVAGTTTTASGRYHFEWVASQDSVLQTSFSGSLSGVHPHSHACTASTSRTLRVNVRGAGGTNDVIGAGGGDVTGVTGTAASGRELGAPAIAAVAFLTLGAMAIFVARRRSLSAR